MRYRVPLVEYPNGDDPFVAPIGWDILQPAGFETLRIENGTAEIEADLSAGEHAALIAAGAEPI